MAYRRKKPPRQEIIEELPPVVEEPQPEEIHEEPLMIQKIDEEAEIEVEEFTPEEQVIQIPFPAPEPDYTFYVQVNAALRKRRQPNLTSDIVGYITDNGIYLIKQTRSGWGQLTDGSWINLEYTERV